uniref:Uncharacterized protein n=1 Tax=Pseudomonas aeruginosa TaxID=287 RepID=Q9S444_PSEAI|nr:unknown [Pseudomonas aeruginosa]
MAAPSLPTGISACSHLPSHLSSA